ncbi:MAG: response regulator [Acidimicrobiia bacterium]|nr:response regulator [Acidimicrobiia bacterium]
MSRTPAGTDPRARGRTAALARFLDEAPFGAFVGTVSLHEPGDGTVVAMNPAVAQLFGAPAQARLHPLAPERFGDPAARKVLLDRLRAGEEVADHLVRMRTIDGAPLWVEVTATAMPSRRRGVIAVRALLRDVSDRRRRDDQSRALHQQLLQADKMAALGHTVSGVAHELNNPLATILSWAERLSERPLPPGSREGVRVILAEAERAARIVRNLLTLARKRQSTRAMVDVNEIIRHTLALRADDQQALGVVTVQDLAEGLPPLLADGHQIQQVLLNLVINAEQAMRAAHGGGRLLVRTSFDRERHRVVLAVDDDGPGIPEEVRARIFDPFFTTKAVGEGTGLGLSVAYALVQEHGGRIDVGSAPGGGAAFRVALPVSTPLATPPPRPVTTPPRGELRGRSVLVVEDERPLAAAVLEALGDAGLTVTYAEDGAQALARLAERRFDLVICDLKMPRADGQAVYRALQALDPPPPAIFVTGEIAGGDAERFLHETRARWLAKPFRLAELLQAVRDALVVPRP